MKRKLAILAIVAGTALVSVVPSEAQSTAILTASGTYCTTPVASNCNAATQTCGSPAAALGGPNNGGNWDSYIEWGVGGFGIIGLGLLTAYVFGIF